MDIRSSLVPLVAGILAAASVHLGAQAAAANPGFAVLELFTSEGCSSCPPADDVLSEISQAVQKEGLPVFPLEWHVDYWDRLGWKDPFDSHAATDRQYAYSRSLPSGVYTPQLVINGTLVPSYAGNRSEIDRDIRAVIRAPASAELHVRVLSVEPDSSLRVRAEISKAPANARLLLVLTESGLTASPTAGENAGRHLAHSNVVRSFAAFPAATAEARLTVPAGVDLARSRLVGILQDTRTMKIYAADQAAMPGQAAARLSGKVIDAAGRPVAGVLVQACSGTVCVPAVTGAEGTFLFEQLDAGSWSLVFSPSAPAARVVLAPGRQVSLSQPLVLGITPAVSDARRAEERAPEVPAVSRP